MAGVPGMLHILSGRLLAPVESGQTKPTRCSLACDGVGAPWVGVMHRAGQASGKGWVGLGEGWVYYAACNYAEAVTFGYWGSPRRWADRQFRGAA